jgi:serine/threonine-protein kinase HSL1 (negative regulator of Swe1 kinase)
VKLVDLDQEGGSLPDSFEAEINALVKLNHPNVIKIYNYFRSESLVYMILEFCPGGSLRDVIDNQGPIAVPQLYELSRQLVSALAACHAFEIAHRDIKPGNILIDGYGRAKLADFGLACRPDIVSTSTQVAGSLPYVAPETLSERCVDPRPGDIWSLGVTLYEMAVGSIPWNVDHIKHDIQAGRVTYPGIIPHEFRVLLSHMLRVDPKMRWSCADILECEIFKNSDSRSRRPNVLSKLGSMTKSAHFARSAVYSTRKRGISHALSSPSTFLESGCDSILDYQLA